MLQCHPLRTQMTSTCCVSAAWDVKAASCHAKRGLGLRARAVRAWGLGFGMLGIRRCSLNDFQAASLGYSASSFRELSSHSMFTARSATPCALCRAKGCKGHPGVNVQISLEFREVGALSNFYQADHIKCIACKSEPHTCPSGFVAPCGSGTSAQYWGECGLPYRPTGHCFHDLLGGDVLRDVNGAQGTHARIPPGHLRVDGMRMRCC